MLEMWRIYAVGKGPIYPLRPRECAASHVDLLYCEPDKTEGVYMYLEHLMQKVIQH